MNLQTGSYISEELSDYIRKFTSEKERIKITGEHDGSYHTLTHVIRMSRKVSEEMRPILERVVEKAISNGKNYNALHEKILKKYDKQAA